jgi:hypothetical protein
VSTTTTAVSTTTTVSTAEPTAATAVESAAAAAEAATTVVTTTTHATPVIATCPASCEGVSATGVTGRTVVIAAASPGIANAAAIPNPTAIAYSTVSTATVVAATTVVTAATPISVIPRSGADKDAAHKPARSVITIRGATIGSIRVVAPRANRSIVPIPVTIPNPNPNTNLSLSGSRHKRRRNRQRAEQQEVSEKFHFGPPRQGIMQCVTNRFGVPPAPLVNFGCLLRKTTFLLKSCAFQEGIGKRIAIFR